MFIMEYIPFVVKWGYIPVRMELQCTIFGVKL